jgi:hypothetical protein
MPEFKMAIERERGIHMHAAYEWGFNRDIVSFLSEP